ncbi:hypothetical protein CWR45_11130 [Oceanobacillus chungangensis]|uniref:Uncharacterized protein n=1 Tax=Oceanobacillus chungangensis TaxID=1229152 RepID=A0A3D8PRI0_9BACI|nr:hypothetical protein CWR45_11130 [Oceanobacillus chungangensis]
MHPWGNSNTVCSIERKPLAMDLQPLLFLQDKDGFSRVTSHDENRLYFQGGSYPPLQSTAMRDGTAILSNLGIDFLLTSPAEKIHEDSCGRKGLSDFEVL